MIQVSGLTRQQVQDAKGRPLTRYGLHAHVLLSTDRVALLLLALLFTASVVVVFASSNTYDSGDSVLHYLFAHWAWQHPDNLLNSWAKPPFTLLASGPAQLGFRGIEVFQCVVVAASAWAAYTIARRLALPWPALVLLFCYAAPDYFRIQFSGLTEPLFGLVLVAGVALALHGHYRASAAVLSWLPVVRSEGIALWGLWVVYLVWARQWRALPWLALGMVAYSVVGGLFLHFNFLWLFTNSPYALHSQYGSGPWRHFLDHFPTLLGWPLTVLLLLGAASSIRRMLHLANWARPEFRGEVLLLDGAIVLFTLVQSVLWAYGLFGSFGMLRVMTTLVPLCAVVALSGLAWVAGAAGRRGRRWVLAGGALAVVVLLFGHDYAFTMPDGQRIGEYSNLRWNRDFAKPGDLLVAEQGAAWLHQHDAHWRWHSLAYEHPYYGIAFGIDPFNPAQRAPLVQDYVSNRDGLPIGTYVLWDEFWASGSGQLPLDVIDHDPRYRKRWSGEVAQSEDNPDWKRRLIIYERIN